MKLTEAFTRAVAQALGRVRPRDQRDDRYQQPTDEQRRVHGSRMQ